MAAEGTLETSALWYARHGLAVFPVRERGKEPLTERGFRDATCDLEAIAGWWTRWPDANIGVPCASNGLIVLDVDPRNGGPADRDDLVDLLGPWPDTAEVLTGGGGRHIYFRHPGGRFPAKIADGVDVKTDGYVLAPPSIHPSGNPYLWDGSDGATALRDVADAPEWLTRHQRTQRPTQAPAGDAGEPIPEGGRNNALASLAGKMRAAGLGESAIAAALLAENAARCTPPLPEGEVMRIAASIARYEPVPAPEVRRRPPPVNVGTAQTPQEAITLMNGLSVFAEVIRWAAWKRRGGKLLGVTADGEEIRIDASKLLTFAHFQNEVFISTGRVLPNPKRGETRTVWHTAAQLIHRAAASDSTDTGNPEDDILADLARCWRAAGSPTIERGGLGPILRRLLTYRRDPYGELGPECVFVMGGEVYVYPPVFRAWLSTPTGSARHVSLREIRDALAVLEFSPREVDTDSADERLRLTCWVAAAGVLSDG